MMPASSTLTSRRPLKGRHVLFAFLTFFAAFASVDAFMIYRALSTFGGVDNANAYRDGLAYNTRIAQGEEQDRAGWNDSVEVLKAPHRIRLTLRDRDGRPLADSTVRATIGRPATNRYDKALPLSTVEPGVFEADVASLEPGSWVVAIEAFQRGEHEKPLYEMRRRVWLGQ
jgi:nitrogen fixation protein FixH